MRGLMRELKISLTEAPIRGDFLCDAQLACFAHGLRLVSPTPLRGNPLSLTDQLHKFLRTKKCTEENRF